MERTQIPVYSLLAERIRIIGREADMGFRNRVELAAWWAQQGRAQ